MITAGCNQAFCLAMMSLAQAGDEIVMPAPFYFNYEMWLQMLGIRLVRSRSARSRRRARPRRAARAIGPKTKAIVLVSPNNPTGAVYKPETLRAFLALARERGIALVLDETYRDFLPIDGAPHDLFRDADWPRTLIHLYSFSKVSRLPATASARSSPIRASSTTRPRRWIASRSARRAWGRRRRISASAIWRTGGAPIRT